MNQLNILIMSCNDVRRRQIVSVALQAGISARGCRTPMEMFSLMAEYDCDAVVLDVRGAGDGYALIARLRTQSSLGIVVVGADAVDMRLRCLQSGADACLPHEPYDPREAVGILLALARRLPRDAAPADGPGPEKLGRWELRDGNWTLVSPRGATLSLSSNERLILPVLLKEAGNAVTRQALLEALRAAGEPAGMEDPELRSIGVIISRLRRKAEVAGITLPLRTVYGSGYLFADDDPG